MKYLSGIILGLLIAITTANAADTYTTPSGVRHLTINGNTVRVRVASMQTVPGCSDSYWYAMDLSEPYAHEKYLALLEAKRSKQPVFFQLLENQCHLNYPKIATLYICDNAQCK